MLILANIKTAALQVHRGGSLPALERSRSHALMYLSIFLRFSHDAANLLVGLRLVNFYPDVKAAAEGKM
jgi:hypothetical protein